MTQVALKCTGSFIRKGTANLKKRAIKSMIMTFINTKMILIKKIALKDISKYVETSAKMVNVSTWKGGEYGHNQKKQQ